MTDKNHIFISYARQDGRGYAEQLDNDLTRAGFRTWRDTRNLDPNQDFTAELEHAIEDSTQVICCITPDTRRNDSFVRREIGYALALKKPLVPLIFQDTLPPIHIINITRVDFTQQPWTAALAQLQSRLNGKYEITDHQITLPQDPFRDYLNSLYQNIVRYLKQTVFSLITLHSESTPSAVQAENTQVLPMAFFDMAGIHQTETRFSDFREAFDKNEGRILLLGEAGAGKTTTLMAFARDMVARRLENASLPLPILVPIATWDAQMPTSLVEWLVQAIPVLPPNDIAHAVREGKTILFLDGLDELGSVRQDPETQESYDPRSRFIQILPSNNLLVVTCRITDYADIGEKIALKGAVTLQPLNDAQMQVYLDKMPDLWAALEADNELRDIARTPLLLSLFTFAFAGLDEDTQKLRNLSRGDLRDKIFEMFIKRRYEREARKPHTKMAFSLEEIYELLGYIALESAARWDAVRMQTFGHPIFAEILSASDIEAFIELVKQLNLLVDEREGNFRFIHLLLRDYLAFKHALSCLQNNAANLRMRAVYALSNLKDKRAVDILIPMLDDKNVAVRRSTVHALTELQDRRAVEPLMKILNDPDKYVRSNVVAALGKLGDKRATSSLVMMMEDESAVVRSNVVEAFGKLEDSNAIPSLISVLKTRQTEHIRSQAALALGKIGGSEAMEALTAALNDPEDTVAGSAAGALKMIGTPEALSIVETWQRDEKVDS